MAAAITDELAKMDKYKVWEVVDRQPTIERSRPKWVFTRKIDGETGKASCIQSSMGSERILPESKESTTTSSMPGVHTKTLSESSFPSSTTSTSNAIKSTSRQHSSMVISRKPSTSHPRKAATSQPTRFSFSENLYTA